MADIYVVRVFPDSPEGGNPAPTVLDAEALDSEAMRGIAARDGHESGFVLPASPGSTADFRFRFFVPRHEMEMCGHATIGALWLLRRQGRIGAGTFCIETLSGIVYGIVPDDGPISISQPAGVVEALTEADAEAVCDVLGIGAEDLAEPLLLNARTSRIKTLVALKDPGRLHGLAPDFSRMDAVCGGIGSTGLYPFAKSSRPGAFHARQFPRASGYPEDAATGIAASALAFGLLHWNMVPLDREVRVLQGEAMGLASAISVSFEQENGKATRCWISGDCRIDETFAALES